MKSKIKELFTSDKSVYFFDVDGVLAIMEFGVYNHFGLNDEEWARELYNKDFYLDVRVNITIQKFLKDKDMSRVYVISKAFNDKELEYKKNFAVKNFGIKSENVFMVQENNEKLDVMLKIKDEYSRLEDKYFIMIDDSVSVLNNIKDNSNFSTVHVSSFFE